MNLGKRQEEFALSLAKLIIYADSLGYSARIGHVLRCEDCKTGKKYSVHKLKLAADLLIYPDGLNILDSDGYNKLHDFWDSLGGAPRIEYDLNHFSFSWRGKW